MRGKLELSGIGGGAVDGMVGRSLSESLFKLAGGEGGGGGSFSPTSNLSISSPSWSKTGSEPSMFIRTELDLVRC